MKEKWVLKQYLGNFKLFSIFAFILRFPIFFSYLYVNNTKIGTITIYYIKSRKYNKFNMKPQLKYIFSTLHLFKQNVNLKYMQICLTSYSKTILLWIEHIRLDRQTHTVVKRLNIYWKSIFKKWKQQDLNSRQLSLL